MSYKIEEDKLSIIFDTNALETRTKDEIAFLYDWKASNEFYNVVNFVKENNFEHKVRFCIPDIVLLEIKQHFLKGYESQIDSLKSNIENFKSKFGSLVDINYIYNIDIDMYEEHVDSFTNSFLSKYNCEILESPKEIDVFNNIVDKAIKSKKPFVKGKINGKEFSDAGFKDALIVETILNNNKKLRSSIFMTNDNDFTNVFTPSKNNVSILSTSKDIIEYISEKFKLSNEELYKSKIENEEYYKSIILDSIGVINDKSLTKYKVNSIKMDENENYEISIICISNETNYLINTVFDPASNEFLSIENVNENE